jgi:NitT/TauT family transport system substrate-binding protein
VVLCTTSLRWANPFDSFLKTRPGLPTGHWVTTTRQTAKEECIIRAFGRAVTKSNVFANTHPDAVRTAIGQYTKIPAPVIAKITLPTWTDRHDIDGLKVIAKLTEKYVDIDESVDAHTQDVLGT